MIYIFKLNIPAQKVIWSPKGTYLASLSPGGVCIGVISPSNTFELICTEKMSNVTYLAFSPNEKLICLFI